MIGTKVEPSLLGCCMFNCLIVWEIRRLFGALSNNCPEVVVNVAQVWWRLVDDRVGREGAPFAMPIKLKWYATERV
jgi:hypothetical protein